MFTPSGDVVEGNQRSHQVGEPGHTTLEEGGRRAGLLGQFFHYIYWKLAGR